MEVQLTQSRVLVRMVGFVVIAFAACLIGACSEDEQVGATIFPVWTALELAAIPDTLLVGEYTFVVDAHLNRDFMPPTSPDGGPMSAGVEFREVAQKEYEYPIHDPTLYVVNGMAMWTASMIERSDDYFPDYVRYFSAWSGPKWGPDIVVDVVFQFRDDSGTVRHIIARGINIDGSS